MAYGLDTSQMLQAFGQLQQSNAAMRQRKDAAAAKRRSGISAITTTAGTVIGGIYGGPMGAAVGGAIGKGVGGMMGGNAMTAQDAAQSGAQIYGAHQNQQARDDLQTTNEAYGKEAAASVAPIAKQAQEAQTNLQQSQQGVNDPMTNLKNVESLDVENNPIETGLKQSRVIEAEDAVGQSLQKEQAASIESAATQTPFAKAATSLNDSISKLSTVDPRYEEKVNKLTKDYTKTATSIAGKQFVAGGKDESGRTLSGDQILENTPEEMREFITPKQVEDANDKAAKAKIYDDYFETRRDEGEILDIPNIDIPKDATLPQIEKIAEGRLADQRFKKVESTLSAAEKKGGASVTQMESAVDSLNKVGTPRANKKVETLTRRIKQKYAKQDQQSKTKDGKLNLSTTLRKEYVQQRKRYDVGDQQWDRIRAASETATPSGVSDLTLIFAYMKMVDPESVVRESEFATAEAAQGVPDRLRTIYNKVVKGDKLSPRARKRFMGMAAELHKADAVRKEKLQSDYTGLSKRYGLDKENVIPDLTPNIAEPKKKRTEAQTTRARNILDMYN